MLLKEEIVKYFPVETLVKVINVTLFTDFMCVMYIVLPKTRVLFISMYVSGKLTN